MTTLKRWASTISHDYDWERVFAGMLTVCFDAAGKDTDQDHGVVVVSGFCGFAKVWEDFDKAWGDRISQDGLTWFHSVDFAHSTGEFKTTWKGNESRRRSLSADLMAIIQGNGLRKLGCIVKLGDFKSVAIPIQEQSGCLVIDAYTCAATNVVDQFRAYAGEISFPGALQYVVAQGDGETHLRRVFEEDKLVTPDFRSPFPYEDSGGFFHEAFTGLQAADWVAYEYFLDSNRRHGGQFNSRWALDRFDAMTGSIKIAQL